MAIALKLSNLLDIIIFKILLFNGEAEGQKEGGCKKGSTQIFMCLLLLKWLWQLKLDQVGGRKY